MPETLHDTAMVDLPPDAEIDRLGFAHIGQTTKTHLLFVAEAAPPPGQVAAEMVEEAAARRRRR